MLNLLQRSLRMRLRRLFFPLASDKTLGEDRFNGCFFRCYQGIIKKEMVEGIKYFSNQAICFRKQIKLILCSSQRFVILKKYLNFGLSYYATSLTKLLPPVLQNLISKNQNAFIPRKATQDNVLIAYEMFDAMKNMH